jgi:hypothetical protein
MHTSDLYDQNGCRYWNRYSQASIEDRPKILQEILDKQFDTETLRQFMMEFAPDKYAEMVFFKPFLIP